jgi:drug/metabolite transporter (DMT)-like permease
MGHTFILAGWSMTKQKEAYLYAAAAVLLWSTAASAFKISLRYVDVLCLLFYSAIVSTVVLFCCLLFQKKVGLFVKLSRRDYLHSALLGFLNPLLYYVVLFKAYSLLPAQQAQPLNFVWPITLVLLSIPLLKQKIKPRGVIAVVISFFGVFVISTRGDIFGLRFTSPTGVILAVGSSVIWAVFWIYNVKDKRDEVVKLFLNFAFGSVFIFFAMLLFAKVEVPGLYGMLGAVYVGLFEMGITFLSWLKALKLSKTTAHVANLIYLVPFLSLVVIYFVVGEKILVSTIIGVLFIVGGIVLQNVSR